MPKHNNAMLVYLGANAHKGLVHQLLELNPGIRFVDSAIYPERQESLLGDQLFNESVVTFDFNLVTEPDKIGFTPVSGYNQLEIIESIISDKHLALLWTRFSGKMRWNHRDEVKRYEITYSLTKSALETCAKLRPNVVVFSYEPHMLPMYIFKKVCEALSIKTCTLVISPFNWKVFLDVVPEGNGPYGNSLLRETVGGTFNDSVQRFIDEKKSDYNVAKPFYEKRIQRLGLTKRLMYKLKVNGWKPYKLVLGQIALGEYQRLATERLQLEGLKYICVFLQLQPEQTTLPDGGLFVHHLFVIQMLYAAVSELGISLVVREHPATFESAYDLKWRPRDFYRTIKNIGPNIFFDELSAEPYSLIRNSVGTSAITGTVLLEALLQGRPAIAFGKHPLKGCTATALVDRFKDEVELREKIVKAIAQPPESIVAEVESYLHQAYSATFGPDDYIGNANMSLEKLREARYSGLLQAVQLILRDSIADQERCP